MVDTPNPRPESTTLTRIQFLWEEIEQLDIPGLQRNTGEKPFQQWKDFFIGDRNLNYACFYGDFMGLFNLSQREIKEKESGTDICDKITAWSNLVVAENIKNPRTPNLTLIERGIQLFHQYEDKLFEANLIAIRPKK